MATQGNAVRDGATSAQVFAANVRARRSKMGLTQEALAARAGVSVYTVTRIERGARRASSAMLDAIAGALGVSVATLMRP